MDPLRTNRTARRQPQSRIRRGAAGRYLRDPDSVSPDWRSYFDEITRTPRRQRQWRTAQAEEHPQGNGHGPKVTQIGPSFRPTVCSRRRARHAPPRTPPRRQALSDPPPPATTSGTSPSCRIASTSWCAPTACAATWSPNRSARAAAPRTARTRSGVLRLHRGRHGPRVFDRHDRRPAGADAAADHRAAAQHLLPLDRRAVHAHRRFERAPMAARADGRHREPLHAQPPRAAAHPDAAHRRRRSSRSSSRRDSSARRAFRSKGPKA